MKRQNLLYVLGIALALTLVVAVNGKNDGTSPVAYAQGGDSCDAPLFSFEDGVQGWIPGTPDGGYGDSSATDVITATMHATDGTQSLALNFDHASGDGDAKAVYIVEDGTGWDFSGRASLDLDLGKTTEPTQVALALATGSGWAWQESTIQQLNEGDNQISFDLTRSDWKSAGTGWENNGQLNNLNEVHRVIVIVYPSADGAGTAYLDNVRLCGSGEPATATPEPTATPDAATCLDPMYSFEEGLQGWKGSGYGDSGDTGIMQTGIFATDGDFSAQMEFKLSGADGKSKAIFIVEEGQPWDWTGYDILRFDAQYATNKPVKLTLSLTTGNGWEWYESVEYQLSEGANTLNIDLSSSDWKHAGSNWQNNAAVADLDNVHRLALLLFSEDGTNGVHVDTMRLCYTQGTPPPTATPKPTNTPLPEPTATNTPHPNPTAAAPEDFVSTNGVEFELQGKPFYYAGTNNYYLEYKSNAMVDDALNTAQLLDFNVIRAWGFLDYGSMEDDGATKKHIHTNLADGNYFQYWDVESNAVAINDGDNGLKKLDYAIYAASQRDIKLVIALTNNWTAFGGMDQYVVWHDGEYHDDFYTDPDIKQTYKNWVNHLLNRVNSYSNVAYKDDPTIMAWELANEPRCRSNEVFPTSEACDATMITAWADEMSSYVKSIDSNHLVAMGDEGFYDRIDLGGDEPEPEEYPYSGYDGMDFDKIVALPNIDYGTFHMYPDHWGQDPSWGNQWIMEHIESADAVNKPVVLEEYGLQDQATRNYFYEQWTTTLADNGGDGSHFWMLAGKQDDGTFYPDYDGFTINTESPAVFVLMAHGREMRSRNVVESGGGTCSCSFLPTIMKGGLPVVE